MLVGKIGPRYALDVGRRHLCYRGELLVGRAWIAVDDHRCGEDIGLARGGLAVLDGRGQDLVLGLGEFGGGDGRVAQPRRSEEHTSELQSLMRISYAVFCLKKKT